MAASTVKLNMSVSPEALQLIDELTGLLQDETLLEQLPEVVKGFLDFRYLVSELLTLQVNSGATSTSNLVFSLEPTDRFRVLVAAVRTRDFDSLVVE